MSEVKILSLFGEHVKRMRTAKGYSQEQLAAFANLDRTYISGIERGQRNVSLINLFKLAKALDVPTKQLLDFDIESNNVQ
ncbi:helix-turn-helix domain-containing protein [Nostoc sp. FACHB-110]|uniref:helix-turn-helix domain-containing protein n=1 Tax=Nostoc sp. FACHB-110 TaxID=2692834 RepID=UPI001684A14F|nr:helix-turn-helix transcriptional regulator [Nostoc sp. FACHB-110]MBD2441200.1 helix-turn-helix transcriptional regulator [Nostoc sp. FACHB-110]